MTSISLNIWTLNPEDYEKVMDPQQHVYWHPSLKILGHYGKFTTLHDMRVVDLDHPKCYYCGKFIKKGDWWKGRYSGPCTDCFEDLSIIY